MPVSEQKNNCFQVSQIKGRTDYSTTFLSDFSKLKTSWYHGMAFTKLRLCGTTTKFSSIQGFVKDATRFLTLTQIGTAPSTECKTYPIDDQDFIAKV